MGAGGVLLVVGALAVIAAVVGGKVELWPATKFGQLGKKTRIGLGVVGALFFLVGLWLFVSPPGGETSTAEATPSPTGGPVPSRTAEPTPTPIPSSRPTADRPTVAPTPTPTPTPTPVQPRPRPRPKVGDVDQAFVGRWSGVVEEPGLGPDEYSVRLELVGGKLTQQVGTSTYPSLECRCSLTLVESSNLQVTLDENVEAGDGCKDTLLTLTLNTDGTLSYSFDSGNGTATLSRVS